MIVIVHSDKTVKVKVKVKVKVLRYAMWVVNSGRRSTGTHLSKSNNDPCEVGGGGGGGGGGGSCGVSLTASMGFQEWSMAIQSKVLSP